jgi:thiol peroxidase
MEEHSGMITMKGNPLTLLGTRLKVGGQAPDVELIGNDLQPVRLSSFQQNAFVIASVPSLDTPVCDMETRKFNEAAADLDDVGIIAVSMDLPFAQKRWCGAAGIDKVVTLSDHRDASFGEGYGVLIKELRLLARAVFVLDKERTVRYLEIVKEVTEEPDYQAALSAVKALAK